MWRGCWPISFEVETSRLSPKLGMSLTRRITNVQIISIMESTLVTKQAEMAALCRQFGVSRLDVFGSAAVGGFAPTTSDYDFIAGFSAQSDVSMARRFLGFSDALEALLGRKVDLMTDRRIENPFQRAAVDSSRRTVYVESPSETSV